MSLLRPSLRRPSAPSPTRRSRPTKKSTPAFALRPCEGNRYRKRPFLMSDRAREAMAEYLRLARSDGWLANSSRLEGPLWIASQPKGAVNIWLRVMQHTAQRRGRAGIGCLEPCRRSTGLRPRRCTRMQAPRQQPRSLCLRLQRGCGVRGWGRDGLGTGARGRGARGGGR